MLGEAGYGESMTGYAEIDIAGLRRYRRRPGMANILSRQPMGLWREAYEGFDIQPRNSLLDEAGAAITPTPPFYAERQRKAIQGLVDKGVV